MLHDTTLASALITARVYEKEGEYTHALKFYHWALRIVLFANMQRITSSQAREIQEARHRCYRKLRRSQGAS